MEVSESRAACPQRADVGAFAGDALEEYEAARSSLVYPG